MTAKPKLQYSFPQIFGFIDNVDLRKKVVAFHEKYESRMKETPASVKYHHRWAGGYWDHILEVCNVALEILGNVTMPVNEAGFTPDDLITACYFHDVDKLWRYQLDTEAPSSAQARYAQDLNIKVEEYDNRSSLSAKIDAVKSGKEWNERGLVYFTYAEGISKLATMQVIHILAKEGIVLSDQAVHSIAYHEGGYTPGLRSNDRLEPIAVILHSADLISTFIQNGNVDQ